MGVGVGVRVCACRTSGSWSFGSGLALAQGGGTIVSQRVNISETAAPPQISPHQRARAREEVELAISQTAQQLGGYADATWLSNE